jgi:hypothetical protein
MFHQNRQSTAQPISGSPVSYSTYVSPIYNPLRSTLNSSVTRIFAASSATKEEEERAAQLSAIDPKAKPVHVEKRIWRPQVTSQYKEPDCIPNATSDLEILFKEYGKPIWISKTQLEPRDENDIIRFLPEKHQLEFDRNIPW